MMRAAMRPTLKTATHGRTLKLHRVSGFGEVSKLAGQPQTADFAPCAPVGTDGAINYLRTGVGHLSTAAPAKRGGARNRADRESYELTAAKVDDLVAALRHAQAIGLPINRMITIHWQTADLPLSAMAKATGRFTDLLTKALLRGGSKTAWIWVHENSKRHNKGGHCHLLVHVPPAAVARIKRLQMRWLRTITGKPYKRGVVDSVPIGRKLGLETTNPDLWAENAHATLGYLLKGVTPDAPAAASLARLEAGGLIIGKRCGTSQNIGAKARKGSV